MKRDLRLLRDILEKVESADARTPDSFWLQQHFASEDMKRVLYHVYLLKDGGFVETETTYVGQPATRGECPISLTSDGHDFLAWLRFPGVWEALNAGPIDTGGWTVGLIRRLYTYLSDASIAASPPPATPEDKTP